LVVDHPWRLKGGRTTPVVLLVWPATHRMLVILFLFLQKKWFFEKLITFLK
jgi:hypothetical protein